MPRFTRGIQIIYTPTSEIGFVTEGRDDTTFCRFWSKANPGHLRTLANSEGCNNEDIEPINTDIPDCIIAAWLDHLGYGNEPHECDELF